MKTKNAVRIISLCLAVLMVSIGFLIKSVNKNNRYETELKNSYSRNFDEFSAAINNISLLLDKLRYANSQKQLNNAAVKLLSEAEISKAALSQIPQNSELTVLNRFLSQVGNYAMAVAKDFSQSGSLSNEAEDNIVILADTAKKIADATIASQADYNNGEYWASEIEQKLNETENFVSLADSFDKLEETLADFPTLIYDGPYSDHILEKTPALTEGENEITSEEALAIAIKYCETDNNAISYSNTAEGHIPSYCFKGEKINAEVSKKGGHMVYMRKNRNIGTVILNIDQAREKAKRYLQRMGLSGFKETYYYLSQGILLINFAYVDGETICYTDLIKVGVAMDNGEIVIFEAAGYITNHKDRAFETPAYSKQQAEQVVNKGLTVTGSGLALIPTAADEVRCYEFACTASDGQEILVYINASTLEEEELLILLKNENGTLVK